MRQYKIIQKGNKFCIKERVKSFWGWREKYVGLDDYSGALLTSNIEYAYWTDEYECRELIARWIKFEQEESVFNNSQEKEINIS